MTNQLTSNGISDSIKAEGEQMARSIQMAVRVVPELAELLDHFAADATNAMTENFPGMTIGRVDAVRILLTEGLEKRGYDISPVLEAEKRVGDAPDERNGNGGQQLDLIEAAERRKIKSEGITVEDDLLSGIFTQSEIARRHECSRQHVSQVKKRLSEGSNGASESRSGMKEE